MPAENTKLLPCSICGRQPKVSKRWYTQHQKYSYGARCCFLDLDNSFWDFWTLDELAKVWNRRADTKECARQQPTTNLVYNVRQEQ